jgi:hypothetical protein
MRRSPLHGNLPAIMEKAGSNGHESLELPALLMQADAALLDAKRAVRASLGRSTVKQ